MSTPDAVIAAAKKIKLLLLDVDSIHLAFLHVFLHRCLSYSRMGKGFQRRRH